MNNLEQFPPPSYSNAPSVSALDLKAQLVALGVDPERIDAAASGDAICTVSGFEFWLVESGIEFYGPASAYPGYSDLPGDVVYWGTFRSLEELGALILRGPDCAALAASAASG